jgi:hypothetical protein
MPHQQQELLLERQLQVLQSRQRLLLERKPLLQQMLVLKVRTVRAVAEVTQIFYAFRSP